MKSFVKRLLQIRIVRYGLVGGLGIPINDLALFGFTFLFTPAFAHGSIFLYPVASACAFEVSNLINFVLNQLFTYREQVKHIHGWEWVRRAAKGQLTSLSALLVSYAAALLLVYGLRVNQYLANPAGIVIAFTYNFFISRYLVFRPTTSAASAPLEEPVVEAVGQMKTTSKI